MVIMGCCQRGSDDNMGVTVGCQWGRDGNMGLEWDVSDGNTGLRRRELEAQWARGELGKSQILKA